MRTPKVSPFALRTGLGYSRTITGCYITIIFLQAMIIAYFADRIFAFFTDPFVYFFVVITLLNLYLVEKSVRFLQSNFCLFDTNQFRNLKTLTNLRKFPKGDSEGKLAAKVGLSQVFTGPEKPSTTEPSKQFRENTARILTSGLDWILGISGYIFTMVLLIFVSDTAPLSGTYGNTSFPFSHLHLFATIIGLLPTALGWGSVILFVITIVYTPVGLKKHTEQFRVRKYTSNTNIPNGEPLMDYHQFSLALSPLGDILTVVTSVISVIMIYTGIDYAIRVLSGVLQAEYLLLFLIGIIFAMGLLFIIPQAFLHGILSDEKQALLEEMYKIRSKANQKMLLHMANITDTNLSPYKSNDVEILSTITENLENASTWTSTWYDMARVISSVSLAIILYLIQYFIDSLFGTV